MSAVEFLNPQPRVELPPYALPLVFKPATQPRLKGSHWTPIAYAEHLQNTLQLPAPAEVKLLATLTTYAGFEAWLEGMAGQVTQRYLRANARDKYLWYPINDGDDIEQRGLIFLWQRWEENPAWFQAHAARYIGKVAFSRGKNDRYYFRRRRGNHIEQTADLLTSEAGDEAEKPSNAPLIAPPTHIPPHDQATFAADRRLDVQRAMQATIQELEAIEAKRPPNGRSVPISLIVRTICHAFMYYSGQTMSNGTHPRRTSPDGDLEYYWSQYITERQWYRWKPRVLGIMAKHLQVYAEF